MVSRLTPAIPGMFEKFPGGVGLVRTYIGSAHEKDSDGESVSPFIQKRVSRC